MSFLIGAALALTVGLVATWIGFVCLAYDGVAACYLGILLMGPRAARRWGAARGATSRAAAARFR
jgi:hypothetical protein